MHDPPHPHCQAQCDEFVGGRSPGRLGGQFLPGHDRLDEVHVGVGLEAVRAEFAEAARGMPEALERLKKPPGLAERSIPSSFVSSASARSEKSCS